MSNVSNVFKEVHAYPEVPIGGMRTRGLMSLITSGVAAFLGPPGTGKSTEVGRIVRDYVKTMFGPEFTIIDLNELVADEKKLREYTEKAMKAFNIFTDLLRKIIEKGEIPPELPPEIQEQIKYRGDVPRNRVFYGQLWSVALKKAGLTEIPYLYIAAGTVPPEYAPGVPYINARSIAEVVQAERSGRLRNVRFVVPFTFEPVNRALNLLRYVPSVIVIDEFATLMHPNADVRLRYALLPLMNESGFIPNPPYGLRSLGRIPLVEPSAVIAIGNPPGSSTEEAVIPAPIATRTPIFIIEPNVNPLKWLRPGLKTHLFRERANSMLELLGFVFGPVLPQIYMELISKPPGEIRLTTRELSSIMKNIIYAIVAATYKRQNEIPPTYFEIYRALGGKAQVNKVSTWGDNDISKIASDIYDDLGMASIGELVQDKYFESLSKVISMSEDKVYNVIEMFKNYLTMSEDPVTDPDDAKAAGYYFGGALMAAILQEAAGKCSDFSCLDNIVNDALSKAASIIGNIPGIGSIAYEALKDAVNDLMQRYRPALERLFGASVATPNVARPSVAQPVGGLASEGSGRKKRRATRT
jgi:hypothetical protein